MGLKLKIIMNPSSGRETARLNVEDMLAYLVSLGMMERADIYYTSGKNDATRFAAATDPSEYDYLIAVGGDGTVNEVVTGMLNAGVDIPLAIYTSGTVNDFATINRLPTSPSEFARMLMNPSKLKVDCGKAGDSFFLNVLAAGLLTDVAYKVPSDLKTVFGPAAYWISAAKDLSAISRTLPVSFKTETAEYNEDIVMFLISNTKSVGGFRKLMKKADLTDGKLDVLILKKLDAGDFMPLVGNFLVGDHINNDRVIYFQTDKLEISSNGDSPIIVDIDGEKGPALPIKVECIHDAVTLVVPREEDL